MNATERILRHASQLGFDDCAVARCHPLNSQRETFEEWLEHGYDGSLGYLRRHVAKRFDPSLLVEGARSVIVCAVSYHRPLSEGDIPSRIASYAHSRDYHLTFREKLAGLAQMRRVAEVDYDITAVTIDPGFNGVPNNYEAVARLCEKLDVPFSLVHTQIGEIVFDIRKEPNPCSLCANMRRGALHDAAKAAGCNKLALGHNNDDVIETFIMNLFNEGRIGCFSPKTHLDRKDITVIRPLVLAPESQVLSACNRNGFEIVKSVCPADKTTTRQKTKEFLRDMEHKDKGFKLRMFTALRKSGVDGWGYPDK